MSRSESKTPTYAIVLAVIFALACLVGLFFLLIKENMTTGFRPGKDRSTAAVNPHAVMIPVQRPAGHLTRSPSRVNYTPGP